MTPLFAVLQQRVAAWREAGYPTDAYPAISEILGWAAASDDGRALRFLRRPQVLALETYWYLRMVEGTPHIFDLYRRLYPPEDRLGDLLAALGIPDDAFRSTNFSFSRLTERIQADDAFVKDFKLEALRETLTLG